MWPESERYTLAFKPIGFIGHEEQVRIFQSVAHLINDLFYDIGHADMLFSFDSRVYLEIAKARIANHTSFADMFVEED